MGAVKCSPTFSSQGEHKAAAVIIIRAHASKELTEEQGDGCSCGHIDSLARLGI